MTTLNDIIAKFDALKPGLAADYTEMVTRQYEELVKAHGNSFRGLSSSWSREGYIYRAIRCYIKGGEYHTKDEQTSLDSAYLAKKAMQYADAQIAAFTSKLVKKLGALTEVTIADLDIGGFTFEIYGKLGERSVRVEQNRIINVSPLGNPFHQWPARIYVDGKFTPEAKFKTLAAA